MLSAHMENTETVVGAMPKKFVNTHRISPYLNLLLFEYLFILVLFHFILIIFFHKTLE